MESAGTICSDKDGGKSRTGVSLVMVLLRKGATKWKRKCFGEQGSKKRSGVEGTGKEDKEEQEGNKQQLYEEKVLETAEGPFWDLSLRHCLRDGGDGVQLCPRVVVKECFLCCEKRLLGWKSGSGKLGTTKHLVCCYLGRISMPLSFCWDWVKY